jgi:hypothetical protein
MGLKGERTLKNFCNGIPCKIIFCGADAPGRNDDLGPVGGVPDDLLHSLEIISNSCGLNEFNPILCEASGNVRGVCIDELTQKEL